jgi:KipI family sensor histidine kinase inhibitor
LTTFSPRVLPVGDRALTVQVGDRLDEARVGRVRTLDARLLDRGLDGVLETVPTYASLLVVYDRARISFAELSRALLALATDLDAATVPGRLVEIPVRYDGEDLDEVASTCGMTREEVVARHSGRDYSALMLGFSPGFAYMGFVEEALRLPRRRTPRTRVPAGSVAIAGAQTGVYPRSLPGGWNLLGRTTERLFDATTAEPSRLLPGDRVRFVPIDTLVPPVAEVKGRYDGHDVRVAEAGILSTIQDAGRPGLRRVAVPTTGFADAEAARRANACVSNPPGHPVIEICGPGLHLEFGRSAFVALSGARVRATLERADFESGRMTMPMDVAVRARPGNVLSISALEGGTRVYVAIAGLEAPRVLGSASVDLGSGFLRPLEAGDGFVLREVDADRVRRDPISSSPQRQTIRVILGPQADHFDDAAIDLFLGAEWSVGLDSDRVGARLNGPRIPHAGATEIVSDGMVPGCIQIPPDGRPIVMLADCPTTGGYPKVACVVTADLGLVAQARPDETRFRFVAVSVDALD